MADQNFMDLASKTASGIAGTDYMMLVNNSEAYKALVNDVAEAILSKLTSKSFSGLETTAKNVIGALNELNSNFKNFSSSHVYKNTDDMKRIIEEFDSGIHIIRIAGENEFNPTETGSVCIIINISVKGSDISMMGWDIRFTNLYSRIRTSASGWGEWKTI